MWWTGCGLNQNLVPKRIQILLMFLKLPAKQLKHVRLFPCCLVANIILGVILRLLFIRQVVRLCKKIAKTAIFLCQAFNKPDSVQPKSCRNTIRVVSIINLQIALPQNVMPSTRFRVTTGTGLGILLEVAAHRDCPFHRDLTRSSLLL